MCCPVVSLLLLQLPAGVGTELGGLSALTYDEQGRWCTCGAGTGHCWSSSLPFFGRRSSAELAELSVCARAHRVSSESAGAICEIDGTLYRYALSDRGSQFYEIAVDLPAMLRSAHRRRRRRCSGAADSVAMPAATSRSSHSSAAVRERMSLIILAW